MSSLAKKRSKSKKSKKTKKSKNSKKRPVIKTKKTKRVAVKKETRRTPKKYAPLSSSFTITSIVGFIISVLYVRKFSVPWATAFATVFLIMFFASLLAMERADPALVDKVK